MAELTAKLSQLKDEDWASAVTKEDLDVETETAGATAITTSPPVSVQGPYQECQIVQCFTSPPTQYRLYGGGAAAAVPPPGVPPAPPELQTMPDGIRPSDI